jgi:membrane-bound metal-dependent hydrolase YbcI (DUF457 family)
MMRETHTIAGGASWIALSAPALRLSPPSGSLLVVLAAGIPLAAFSARAPDLDKWLGERFHRKATHSFIGLGLFGGTLLLLAGSIHASAWFVVAAMVGYASHIATDCLTQHGCPLFWPDPRCYHWLPEHRRISTGGKRTKRRDWLGRETEHRGLPVGEFVVTWAHVVAAVLSLMAFAR